MRVTFTVESDNPDTVEKVLARKLGRQPTRQELIDDVRRIFAESRAARRAAREVAP